MFATALVETISLAERGESNVKPRPRPDSKGHASGRGGPCGTLSGFVAGTRFQIGCGVGEGRGEGTRAPPASSALETHEDSGLAELGSGLGRWGASGPPCRNVGAWLAF